MVISTGRQLLGSYLHTIGLKVYLAKNPPQRTLRWVALRGMILVVGLALFQQQGQGGAGQQQASRHKRPSADAAGFRQVVAGPVGHRYRCCSTACGAGHPLHCAVQVIAIGSLHFDIQVLACGKPCPGQGAICLCLVHRLQVPCCVIFVLVRQAWLLGNVQCVISVALHLVRFNRAVQGKVSILQDIFWQMNEISSRTESSTETIIEETDDGNGNIVETSTTVTRTTLYITVSHKTAEEMAAQYVFSTEQRQQLSELLASENNSLWSAGLYGISVGDGEIVSVALSQVGNVGGQPYWSWYGFNSRVEWCACFVSWCANECGYIDSGIIPKFAACVNGVQWFKDRGQWQDRSFEPSAGQIIFFDWDNKGSSGPQDGQSDHVGIVEKCENGIVYTIEGNSGDSCRQRQYPVGHYEILGYGVPAY